MKNHLHSMLPLLFVCFFFGFLHASHSCLLPFCGKFVWYVGNRFELVQQNSVKFYFTCIIFRIIFNDGKFPMNQHAIVAFCKNFQWTCIFYNDDENAKQFNVQPQTLAIQVEAFDAVKCVENICDLAPSFEKMKKKNIT